MKSGQNCTDITKYVFNGNCYPYASILLGPAKKLIHSIPKISPKVFILILFLLIIDETNLRK